MTKKHFLIYLMALMLPILVLLIHSSLPVSFSERPITNLFLIPIIIVSLMGGLRSGLLTTFVTAVLVPYFLFNPTGHFWMNTLFDQIRWGLTLVIGVLISLVCESLHRAKRLEITRRLELEVAISQSQQVEKKLHQNESFFRSIFDLGNLGIAVTSPDKGWLLVNPRLCQMLGYVEAELTTMTWAEMTYSEDLTADVQRFGQMLSGEIDNYGMDKRFVRKDGSILYTHLTVSCYREADKVEFVIATLLDISASKQVEERLQESEARFRGLFEQAAVGMIQVEPLTGRFVEVNPAYSRIVGYSIDELLQMNFQSLTHPDDVVRDVTNVERLRQGELTQYSVEKRYLTKDGQIVWVDLTVSPLWTKEGMPSYHIAITQDITERKRTETELKASQEELKKAHHLAKLGSWTWERLTDTHVWSDEVFNIYGRDPALPPAAYPEVQKYFTPESWANLVENIEKAIQTGMTYECDAEVVRPDGEHRWIVARGEAIRDAEERVVCLHGTVQDITERKLFEEKLRLTARVFETTLEGIMITDTNGAILEVNIAFTLITGYGSDEVKGKKPDLLKSGYHKAKFYQAMWESIIAKGHWSGEIWNRRKNNEIYPEWLSISAIANDKGQVTHYVGIFSDISLIKEHEKQLEHIAHYDSLTGIPNRVLLLDRMRQAMAQTRRHEKLLAICYLDLDGFKPINDTLGHDAGDIVLIEIAKRIKHALRSEDTVARLGGDEFVILLLDVENVLACHHSLNRLLSVIADDMLLGGKTFTITASIGVTFFPHDDQTSDTLLRHADQAMYIAKRLGKNCYYIFNSDEDVLQKTQTEQRKRIKNALLDQQFELFYQPKVTLADRHIVGAEALIRWNNPERGLLSPHEFLPYIENTELDIQLGEWVIVHALKQIDDWNQQGLILEISINISAYHLQTTTFIPYLKQQLKNYPSIAAHQLQIEILETAALSDIFKVSSIMNACEELGVNFALDDFGMGYSSLAYLRRLPAKTLKIDQSFVRDMLSDQEDRAIIKGVIALSKTFNRTTVAEGVESEAHFEMLREMGCDIAQGYGIARPMPAREIKSWCENF